MQTSKKHIIAFSIIAAICLCGAIIFTVKCIIDVMKYEPDDIYNVPSLSFDNANIEKINMPIIKITTKSKDKNALDFVTKTTSPVYKLEEPDAQIIEPYYENCYITVLNDNNNKIMNNLPAKVKVRGNFTTLYDKKALRIKFDKKQNMLGLNNNNKFKNWVLLAEYRDVSMLRNKTTMAIADILYADENLYVTDTQFVEVYINDIYWGVYLLAEQQEININRVNVTKAEDNYTKTDIGYLIELDYYSILEEPLQRFDIDYIGFKPLKVFDNNSDSEIFEKPVNIGYTIKNDIYSEEQNKFIQNYIDKTYKIMYYAAYENKAYIFDNDYKNITETTEISPREAVEKVVNINSLVNTYVLNEIVCNPDLCWSSFYMSVDFSKNGDKKLTFQAPWDFDNALGQTNVARNPETFFASNLMPAGISIKITTINPWLTVLIHTDWFKKLISEKWTKVYDSGSFNNIYKMIETDFMQYEDCFNHNYEKWDNIKNNRNTFMHELSPNIKNLTTQKQAVNHLYQWLRTRINFMNNYWYK